MLFVQLFSCRFTSSCPLRALRVRYGPQTGSWVLWQNLHLLPGLRQPGPVSVQPLSARCMRTWLPSRMGTSSEDRLIYLLSQAQQIQELLAFLRKLSNSGLLQCVAAAAAGESVPSASQRHACQCLLPAIVRRECSPCHNTIWKHYHVRFV